MRRRQTSFIQSRSHSPQDLHPGGFGGRGDVSPELQQCAFDLYGCVVRRRLPHCQLTLPAPGHTPHTPHCEFTLPAHTPQCLPAHTASRVGLCRRRSVSTLPPPRLFCSNAGPDGIAQTAGRTAELEIAHWPQSEAIDKEFAQNLKAAQDELAADVSSDGADNVLPLASHAFRPR